MLQALEEIENSVVIEPTESSVFIFHDKWLEILPSATKDMVIAKAQHLSCIEDDLPFYHGRLMRELRDRFGMSHEDIALLMGYDSKQTVVDRISVDSRVPIENRGFSRRIKYSHYRLVAALSHEEQVKWLSMADNERIGANQMFGMIKESKGLIEPLRFPEPTAKSSHDIEHLPALGSAGGGSDYVVDRQDGVLSSYGNESQSSNGRQPYDDMDYALGYKAERLGRESDLEDDVEVLRHELDNYRLANEELSTRLKNAREAMADLQESHNKAVERLNGEKDALQAKLDGNQSLWVAVLSDNHLAYDLYLLDVLKRNGLLASVQYAELVTLRNDASFDDGVQYVNEDF